MHLTPKAGVGIRDFGRKEEEEVGCPRIFRLKGYNISPKGNNLPPMLLTLAPHCKYFAWLHEYVSSFNKDASKNLCFGGLMQNKAYFKGHNHVIHDKVKEFDERLAGLEV
ncbi:hypothetical protein AHAS_Ahas11G0222200 [Arachis hypogaea]